MQDHGADGPERPERPAVTGQAPAPLSGRPAVPPVVRRTMTAWHTSLAVTLFAVVTMVLTRDGLATHLAELLHDRDPTISTKTLDSASPRVVLGAVAALAVVAVLELVLVRAFAGRRSWPRFVLVVVVVVHAAVASLAALLVPTSAWQGWLLLGTLYTGVALGVAGAVLSFLPGVVPWLRGTAP